MARASLVSPDIHCDGCAGAIKRSLGKLVGVQSVDVDVADRRVDVEFDPGQTSGEAVRERLAAAGYAAAPSGPSGS